MKIPNTRPNWTTGKYSVYVGDDLIGYFRQYRSAWAWMNYIHETQPTKRIVISIPGNIINVREPKERA